jgi:hypothetical protein
LIKACAVEVTEPINPKLGQGEDNALKCHANAQVQGPQEEKLIDQSTYKELKTIIESGSLHNKAQTKPNDVVVSTT